MAISKCEVHIDASNKEQTEHGCRLFPVACYEENMEVDSVPIHWHDEYEFIFAAEGQLELHVGTNQITLTEGSSIFINSGCIHSVENVEKQVGILKSLVIHPRLIGGSKDSYFWKHLNMPFLENMDIQYIILEGDEEWQQEVNRYMMEAWAAIIGEVYFFENEARYLISKAVNIILDNLNTISHSAESDAQMISRMKILFQFIEDNFSRDLSNSILMEQVACSESALLRSFKKTVGSSPMQYIMNYRIEKAAALLLSTNKKSCDIAMECGFNDFSYFTKVFHRQMGKTPVEYRKFFFNT